MHSTMTTHSNAVGRLRGGDQPDPRLLVVEDDVDLMNVVVRLTGCLDPTIQIDWAVDVEGARERIHRHKYQMVLADYYLTGSKRGLAILDSCLEFQPDAVFAMMSSMPLNDMWSLPVSHDFPYLRKPFSAQECLGFIGAAFN